MFIHAGTSKILNTAIAGVAVLLCVSLFLDCRSHMRDLNPGAAPGQRSGQNRDSVPLDYSESVTVVDAAQYRFWRPRSQRYGSFPVVGKEYYHLRLQNRDGKIEECYTLDTAFSKRLHVGQVIGASVVRGRIARLFADGHSASVSNDRPATINNVRVWDIIATISLLAMCILWFVRHDTEVGKRKAALGHRRA